jgi:hypothetical protein
MLVGARILDQRRGMDAGLGGKSGGADIGRLRRRRAVEQLVEPRESRSALQLLPDDARLEPVGEGRLEASVGSSVTRLALPQRSPMPLSVPWIWRTPARTAASELATACSVSLWAWMPSRSPGMPAAMTVADDLAHLVRLGAAIGVAQHDPARACLVGRLGAGQRIVRIGLVAVEEMLAIDHRLLAGGDCLDLW